MTSAVAYITPSISRDCGGIFEVERRLSQSLCQLGDSQVEVFGVRDRFTDDDMAQWSPLSPSVFPYIGPGNFRYSRGLRRAFLACNARIAHLHAIWTYCSSITAEWAEKWKRPYVVTLHGMLDPWAVRHARWKKIPALFFYERKCLKRAACLHAMSLAECGSVRGFGLRNPVCVIPNGVDIPTEESIQRSGARIFPENRRTLLYIGRLHEKKNLACLLDAWAMLKQSGKVSDWILAIAGWDQDQHELHLRRRAFAMGLEESVRFLGPQFGDQRIACYRDCDGVVLPSLSEGLPMVILEAWAFGKPVIMTPQCNLPEGFALQAAMRVEPTAASISEGVADFLSLSDAERGEMGGRGLALVRERFVWKEVASCLRDVYDWIVGGGPPPACVDIAT